MNNHNILITSAGKRVMLVKLFKKELQAYFPEAKVYTTDMNPTMAPAGYVSDNCFPVPRVTETNYTDILLGICRKYQVKLIIPTIDTELSVLAKNRERFEHEGIEIVVSDTPFIEATRDKRNTGAFFTERGIHIPKPIDKKHPIYPLFAKPYDGSLSKDLHIIWTEDELTKKILSDPKLLFMEYINQTEYKEFTVDMYYGRDHYIKSIVPRERIEIRAGEINKGIVRKNYLVKFLKERLEYLPETRGCICIQFFYREQDNDVIGIEVNARFGGGYPLSYYAGANYPQWIVREYIMGESLEYANDWRNNTLMLRYDAEIVQYDD